MSLVTNGAYHKKFLTVFPIAYGGGVVNADFVSVTCVVIGDVVDSIEIAKNGVISMLMGGYGWGTF